MNDLGVVFAWEFGISWIQSAFLREFYLSTFHLTLIIATLRVASLTLQTRKLWLVDRPSRALPLTCPNVKNFFNKRKEKKTQENEKKRKQKKKDKRT